MESSVKTAKVSTPTQADKDSSSSSSSSDPEAKDGKGAAAVCASSSNAFQAMEVFGRRLDDIIRTHGSAAGLVDPPQSVTEAELEKLKEQLRAGGKQQLGAVQQRVAALLEERQQLQAERRSNVTARCKLETLCKELQSHYTVLREETLQRCRDEEEKRQDITSHFQVMLKEIQTQIEQHSARNDKLCSENANLTDKLEGLMSQCELREESLEKINNRRDLQHKLTEAKLQQANVLLTEAEEKHKREKEYLLREAIDKTKKCYALKEQELAMKKKLTLYAQKFDEFQETLGKSNEIYVRFKKEMDNMSDKMKQVEKESNVWKTRFENCNKALVDMIEERSEKGKEYELFVLKITKLEKLCHALQEERKGLYTKIKEVRLSNTARLRDAAAELQEAADLHETPDLPAEDQTGLLSLTEMEKMQEEDPVLTEDMSRLRDEQAKLREFAASLLATPLHRDEDEEAVDLDEDVVASAFTHFTIKNKVQEQVQEQVDSVSKQSDVPPPEGAPTPAQPSPEAPTSEVSHVDHKPEQHPPQVQVTEPQQVQTHQETKEDRSTAPEPTPEPERATIAPPTDPEPAKPETPQQTLEVQTTKTETPQQTLEVQTTKTETPQQTCPVQHTEDTKTQQQPTEETPKASAPPTETTPPKKQAPKKKKKRNGKSAS